VPAVDAADMSDPFGIGFVGAGFIARESHAPSVEYLPDVRIAGIANPTQSRAEAFADTCREEGWGDPVVYGAREVAALVADPAVDGLWVTSPNDTRVDVVEAAVDAVDDGADLSGIALEKPVARTVDEARHILALLDGADLSHAYLENWPHEPEIAETRELLWERGRDAGRPYLARSKAEHGGPHAGWFWDGQKQGGGALTDMLCHALAGNEFLLSDPERVDEGGGIEAVSVDADTATLKWDDEAYVAQLREEFDVEFAANPVDDYARATVRYETNEGRTVVSEATGSWCFVGAGVSRDVELLGPEYSGQVVTDESASSVFFSDAVGDGEGWAEKQTATSGRMPVAGASVVDGGYVAENRDAVASFSAGENGRFDVEDGLEIVRLCMAAYRAAETGETVDLRSVDLEGYVPPPARP
jgi:predicted dehydrogenase